MRMQTCTPAIVHTRMHICMCTHIQTSIMHRCWAQERVSTQAEKHNVQPCYKLQKQNKYWPFMSHCSLLHMMSYITDDYSKEEKRQMVFQTVLSNISSENFNFQSLTYEVRCNVVWCAHQKREMHLLGTYRLTSLCHMHPINYIWLHICGMFNHHFSSNHTYQVTSMLRVKLQSCLNMQV